jgi:hypothetical protein
MKIAIDFDNTLKNFFNYDLKDGIIISKIDSESINHDLLIKMQEWDKRKIPMGIVTFRKYTFYTNQEIENLLEKYNLKHIPIFFTDCYPKSFAVNKEKFTHIIDDMKEVKEDIEKNTNALFIYPSDDDVWSKL